jgi:class 3 adenylate cyclase
MSLDGEDVTALDRKLAVILASDVAGYSRLVEADEEETVKRFAVVSRTVVRLVKQNRGRVFNTAGDAILAEFDSAVNAVRCAIEIQKTTRVLNLEHPTERALLFRIGIAIGDVMVVENGDLLGDGVNIAARIEALADPGGICVTNEVHGLVQKKIDLTFRDLGTQSLKNMSDPVRAYQIVLGDRLPATGAQGVIEGFRDRVTAHPKSAATAIGLVALGLALAALFLVQGRYGSSSRIPSGGDPRLFDASRVPLVPDEVRRRLVAGYAKAGAHKALAISNEGDSQGIAVNEATEEIAKKKAEERCAEYSKRKCFVYAVGDKIVWELTAVPMAGSDEARIEPLGIAYLPDALALHHGKQRQRLAHEYADAKGPKAVAVGNQGTTGWAAMATGQTPAEAARRALDFCGSRTGGPCIIYAVGDWMTVNLPETYRVVGVFTFAGDTSVPASERERLRAVYRGRDWRALAQGGNGTWHAAAGQTSEAQAIATALAACAAVDRECQIHAINAFRVAGPK